MSLPKAKWLLRVEGVNLSAVLDDTHEISVRRGAGLMLRQAVLDIRDQFAALQPISIGASVGLFELEVDTVEPTLQAVVKLLNRSYPWLTFVVDAEQYDGDFRRALERVIARNRRRQFQQMTLVPPALESGAQSACEMNRIHPQSQQRCKGKSVSASVAARFNYGQQRRQKFYREELEQPDWEKTFTDDLKALSANAPTRSYGNLAGKMAVIYLDGNRFGKIQRQCTTHDALHDFDETHLAYRRTFLRDLVEGAVNDPDFIDGAQKIRLETLLWGGDEIIIIVPAWKGFEVMQRFYEISADWCFKQNPLTHAGGLVFCHHKTPVNEAVKAAKTLADYVKENFIKEDLSEGSDDNRARENNLFEYLVLESIDYPTQEIQSFWQARYGPGVKRQCPPLAPVGGDWKKLSRHLQEWLDTVPKGAVLDIAQAWVREKTTSDDELTRRCKRLQSVDHAAWALLMERVFPLLSPAPDASPENQKDNAAWLHLAELWDYLSPATSARGGAS